MLHSNGRLVRSGANTYKQKGKNEENQNEEKQNRRNPKIRGVQDYLNVGNVSLEYSICLNHSLSLACTRGDIRASKKTLCLFFLGLGKMQINQKNSQKIYIHEASKRLQASRLLHDTAYFWGKERNMGKWLVAWMQKDRLFLDFFLYQGKLHGPLFQVWFSQSHVLFDFGNQLQISSSNLAICAYKVV